MQRVGNNDRCSLPPTKVPDLQDKHDLEQLGARRWAREKCHLRD